MNSTAPASRARSARITIVSTVAAAIACTLAGPFDTLQLPLPTRSLFWLALIGFNAAKWRAWSHFVPPLLPPGHIGDAAFLLGGAVLLNATLPLEINWLFAAVGVPVRLAWWSAFLVAATLSLMIGVVVALVSGADDPDAAPEPLAAPQPPAAMPAPPTGLAARVDLADVHAIVAEDHYLRLYLADGRQPLILYRFGDALRELAGHAGQQVHRSAWVADAAVATALRDGRKWRLQLANGVVVPISQTYLPALRASGRLGRTR